MIEQDNSGGEAELNPGRILSRRREELGMTINDVSEVLRLSTKQIMSLEDNNYQDLPGATYVRGYLRSYARFLKLDESLVIEEESVGQDSTQTEIEAVSVTTQLTISDRWVKLSTIALGVLLLSLFVSRWFEELGNTGSDTKEFMSVTSTLQGENKDTAMEIVSGAVKLERDDQLAAETVSPITLLSTPVDNNNSAKGLPDEPVSKKGDPDQTTGPSSPNDLDSNNQKLPSKKTIYSSTETQVIGSAGVDTEALLITLKASSWIDIRDDTNKKLIYERHKPGDRLKVHGKPPFRIFIGTANNVSMSYQEKEIDIETLKSGSFARFTLGSRR